MKRFTLLLLILSGIICCQDVSAQKESLQDEEKFNGERELKAVDVVAVSSNFANITINGWDQNKIKVKGYDSFNKKSVAVFITEDLSYGKKVLLVSPSKDFKNQTIDLEMKVPHGVKLKPLQIGKGTVKVSNITGVIAVRTNEGKINFNNVGSVLIRTISSTKNKKEIRKYYDSKSQKGNIRLQDINGNTEIITFDSIVSVRQIKGNLQLTSVSSPQIDIRCVAGDVSVNDISSLISINGIGGDLDITNSTGEVHFMSEIRNENRYRMKTLTGVVSMSIPESSNFTASLKTYTGEISSGFKLKKGISNSDEKHDKLMSGTYGTGQARIELDSFIGQALLKKVKQSKIKKCKR